MSGVIPLTRDQAVLTRPDHEAGASVPAHEQAAAEATVPHIVPLARGARRCGPARC